MPKRTYRVSAPTAVLEHEPGETFAAELDPVQEARLLDGGALVVEEAPVAPSGKVAPKQSPSE